jgi:hypothetical protein
MYYLIYLLGIQWIWVSVGYGCGKSFIPIGTDIGRFFYPLIIRYAYPLEMILLYPTHCHP